MSSNQSRDEVLAAREAKKLAKQKAKNKDGTKSTDLTDKPAAKPVSTPSVEPEKLKAHSSKSKDEVDRAAAVVNVIDESQEAKDQVMNERAAKKAAKQAKKKGDTEMTVRDVVETLKDIKNVAKDMRDLTAKADSKPKENVTSKPEVSKAKAQEGEGDEAKSKAGLKAERRAKQEAQRAAKAAAAEKAVKPTEPAKAKEVVKPESVITKEKSPKPKSDKIKVKSTTGNRLNWFQHLHTEHDKESLKKIALNSNLHPAIVKLGVQLATRVVTGSNARCIALLDALKKMIKDYTLPAKTEFSRGFEPQLAASLSFLWSMRQPSASQTNAVKYVRHHLTQLPNNIDEFDAKKILQEEIDNYIEDQIDKAGQAISSAVQQKISNGDTILTYGCSSLVERILREAWQAGIQFRCVVGGDRVSDAPKEMLRRLLAAGLPCTYVDVTGLSYVMNQVSLVVLGACALLAHGGVVGAAGSFSTALAARGANVPVLVACETHKFSERVHTDAFVCNELGDPDDLIDKSDENSPLKDWRSNPNLTPLNLMYDVTPPNLITAVVTEKAILPCTSAPVLLRTKLTEYGM